MLREKLDRDGVPHGAGGDEERGLHAGDFGGALLQAVHGGVLTVNVVADFSFGHGAAHLGCGSGDCIAAEIDHACKNSWKTSLDKRTPRLVRRIVGPVCSSRPAARKRRIATPCSRQSTSSGVTPSSSRRPTKNFSSPG